MLPDKYQISSVQLFLLQHSRKTVSRNRLEILYLSGFNLPFLCKSKDRLRQRMLTLSLQGIGQ